MAAELFSYDWKLDGVPAEYTVDMALPAEALASRPYLFYIQGKSRSGAFTSRESKHMGALEKRVRKELDGVYAGEIRTAERQVFFYYGADPGALEPLRKAVEKEKAIQCALGLREDPRGEIYHRLLYPDAARLFTEENRRQIALLKKHGDMLTPARRIAFHTFFPTEPLAAIFAEGARQAGFAVGDREFLPEQENPYGVVLLRISSLDKAAVDEMTTRIIQLAAAQEGTLQYWDCPIVGKRRG